MIYIVKFKEEADIDIFDAYNWYESRQNDLGIQFLKELEEYVGVLENEPLIYTKLEKTIGDIAL